MTSCTSRWSAFMVPPYSRFFCLRYVLKVLPGSQAGLGRNSALDGVLLPRPTSGAANPRLRHAAGVRNSHPDQSERFRLQRPGVTGGLVDLVQVEALAARAGRGEAQDALESALP